MDMVEQEHKRSLKRKEEGGQIMNDDFTDLMVPLIATNPDKSKDVNWRSNTAELHDEYPYRKLAQAGIQNANGARNTKLALEDGGEGNTNVINRWFCNACGDVVDSTAAFKNYWKAIELAKKHGAQSLAVEKCIKENLLSWRCNFCGVI
jgi:hypothetical protein